MTSTYPFPSTTITFQPHPPPKIVYQNGVHGSRNLTANAGSTSTNHVLSPEISQMHWQQLQAMQENAPGPSRILIDPPNMPQISVTQLPPQTTSWLKDFDGNLFYAKRARLEEVDSNGISMRPKASISLSTLSPSATPPPAPKPMVRSIELEMQRARGLSDLETRSAGFVKSPALSGFPISFHQSTLPTMASSGVLFPHEPNLQEANQKLADHMLGSTGYVPIASSPSRRRRSGRSDNGYPLLSPLTNSITPGWRKLRREHPLQQSFTTSEFGSVLVEKPGPSGRLGFVPKYALADILTQPGTPLTAVVSETNSEFTRQTPDDDEMGQGDITTRQFETPLSEYGKPSLPRVRDEHVIHTNMPTLHTPSTSFSDARTELLETVRHEPVSATSFPFHTPPTVSDSGRGSLSTNRFPVSSTPPPTLRHKPRQPLGPPLSGPSWEPRITDSFAGPSRINVAAPPAVPVRSSQLPTTSAALEQSPDVQLVSVVSQSIEYALRNVDHIRTFFMRVGHLHNVLPHTDTCHRVKVALTALSATMHRRRRFSEEQMRLGTQGWHGKYVERLGSAQRTLKKLCEFASALSDNLRPKLPLVDKVLEKLTEYETKLTNLDTKFNAMFDRLRVRHIHGLLIQAHMDAIAVSRRIDVSEDVKTWAEGKVRRAQLRREYEAYRAGRRVSLIS